ncbi:ABC transporter ATP-binding protein [Candidatus Kapabacteria bacterium]|nr:ABC transporter ATP-binding protein [Candidatus Kapabacteria bacterium]
MPKTKDINTKAIWSRILNFVKPFSKILVISIILGMLFSIFTTLPLALFEIVLELIFDGSITEQTVGIDEDFFKYLKSSFMNFIANLIQVDGDYNTTVLNLSILIVGLFVIKNIVKFLMVWSQTYLQNGIVKSIRDAVFNNLSSLSLDHFSRTRQGNLISIMTNDVEVLNNNTIMSSIKIFKNILEITLKIIFLLAISPFLILISISVSLLTFVVLRFARKYLKKYAKRMQESMADFTSTIQETISGIKIIQAYNAQRKANDRFVTDTRKYLVSTVKHKNIVSIVPGMGEIFAMISLCIVLIFGGGMVQNGEIESSSLILFITMLFGVMAPVTAIINSIAGFQRGYVAADRVFNLLDTKTTINSGEISKKSFENEIIIKDINFSYEETNVLNSVNIKVEKGKKIAFVGASGSGKSTVLDLLLRFYDPQVGEVLLDGQNIKSYDLEDYRRLFGLVSQDTILFNDTLKNNIMYGNIEASDGLIEKSLETAHANDFVNSLPNKVDSIVGDRGQTLSGGERQRVAIARALVRDPEILVFDEATSALDSESEKIVQDAINDALKDRTAIIVAHRLATITHCDLIYVFDSGEIAEYGSHVELLQKDGVYKKLYDIQFGNL